MVNKKALVVLVFIGVLLSVATILTAPKIDSYKDIQIEEVTKANTGIVKLTVKPKPVTGQATISLNVVKERGEI